jgi:CRP/FNR family cyclic AMP-dependent transcriptional regulator
MEADKNSKHLHSNRVLNREIFYKDDIIINQGDAGYNAYYIESGMVEVTVREGPHVISVSKLGMGEIFGEMAIIQHCERSATVKALEATTVTVISKGEIEKMVDKIEQKALQALLRVLSARLKSANHGQMEHYKNLAEFQDRMAGLVQKADQGINKHKRDDFRNEAEPLLKQLEELMDKYKSD